MDELETASLPSVSPDFPGSATGVEREVEEEDLGRVLMGTSLEMVAPGSGGFGLVK
jgi:hypothetical protein